MSFVKKRNKGKFEEKNGQRNEFGDLRPFQKTPFSHLREVFYIPLITSKRAYYETRFQTDILFGK